MFDVIRGRGSVSKTRPLPRAKMTSANDPPLFRAPGVSLRTTPPGLQPVRRAATMPNQVTQGDVGKLEPRNRQICSLVSKRSMTTDERVQYWQRSCERSSPPRLSPATNATSTTVCGACSLDVRHMYVGDVFTFPPQAQQLPPCKQCAILVQTLDRLRQNLSLSEGGSPKLTQKPLTNPSTDCVRPMMPTVVTAPVAKLDAGKSPYFFGMQEARNSNELRKQSSTPEKAIAREQLISIGTSMTPYSQPADTRPKADCKGTTPKEHLNLPNVQDPTISYGSASSGQYPSHPIRADAAGRDCLSHTADLTFPLGPTEMASGSRPPVSVRACRPSYQRERRTSNHTDDRDWMA
jgi:Xaa-Pro dipeptidase